MSLLPGCRISGAAQRGCHQACPLPPSLSPATKSVRPDGGDGDDGDCMTTVMVGGLQLCSLQSQRSLAPIPQERYPRPCRHTRLLGAVPSAQGLNVERKPGLCRREADGAGRGAGAASCSGSQARPSTLWAVGPEPSHLARRLGGGCHAEEQQGQEQKVLGFGGRALSQHLTSSSPDKEGGNRLVSACLEERGCQGREGRPSAQGHTASQRRAGPSPLPPALSAS